MLGEGLFQLFSDGVGGDLSQGRRDAEGSELGAVLGVFLEGDEVGGADDVDEDGGDVSVGDVGEDGGEVLGERGRESLLLDAGGKLDEDVEGVA